MMEFPSSPAAGDVTQTGAFTYQFDGVAWSLIGGTPLYVSGMYLYSSTQAAGRSTVEFDLDPAFDYEVRAVAVSPATTGGYLRGNWSADGGSTWIAANNLSTKTEYGEQLGANVVNGYFPGAGGSIGFAHAATDGFLDAAMHWTGHDGVGFPKIEWTASGAGTTSGVWHGTGFMWAGTQGPFNKAKLEFHTGLFDEGVVEVYRRSRTALQNITVTDPPNGSWEVVTVETVSAVTGRYLYHDGIKSTASGTDFIDGWQYRLEMEALYGSIGDAYLTEELYENGAYRGGSNEYKTYYISASPGQTPQTNGVNAVGTISFASSGGGTTATTGWFGAKEWYNLASTSFDSAWAIEGTMIPSTPGRQIIGRGRVNTSNLLRATTHIRLLPTSGNHTGKLTFLRRYVG